MKDQTALQTVCRDILNGKIQTEEELYRFLESTAVVEALDAFSDKLIQHWHMWKKEQGEEGREEGQSTDDTASKQESIPSASQEKMEAILADFQDGENTGTSSQVPEDSAVPTQDTLNKEEDIIELSADADPAKDKAEPEAEEEKTGKTEPLTEPVESESSKAEATEKTPDSPAPLEGTQQSNTPEPEPIEQPPVLQNNHERQEKKAHSIAAPHLPPQSNTMQQDTTSSPVLFKLPNAMVNNPYSEPLAVESGEVMKITKIEGLEATGVCYNSETQSVEGTPSRPGEFSLTVTYVMQSGGSGLGQLDFVVNHDPKSLWKDIPSDEGVKFWKPDNASGEKEGNEGWKLVAASKRGRSHAHEGSCRDDDFMLINDHPEQWHILAVSDGAGSSQFAREGSRVAVNTSTEILAEKLTEHDVALVEAVSAWNKDQSDRADAELRQVLYAVFNQAIYQAINTVHQTSKKENCKFRDFYATLLLAAHKEIQGQHFIAGYWIGDGGMAVYKKGEDGYLRLLGQPDSGEYAGQTRFLDPEANDGKDIMQRISFASVDSMTALFLLTDGITDPIFETDYNLQQPARWDTFWTEEIRKNISDTAGETEKNLLEWLSFWSPGNHDDRTIALLYQEEGSGAELNQG
jgi:hypothetical protein